MSTEIYKPIYSIETEAIVLGILMLRDTAFTETSSILDPECFYMKPHKQIYIAISQLIEQGYSSDHLSVWQQTIKNGDEISPYDITKLTTCICTHDLELHALILADLKQRRILQQVAMELLSKIADESIETGELISPLVNQLVKATESSSQQIYTLDDAIAEVRKQVEDNYNNKSNLTGTPTGFPSIDKLMGGLQKSDLIIIAADTSQGKTHWHYHSQPVQPNTERR